MSKALYTSEGWMDLEEQYVPGCVAAELADGRAEAIRALAIAARTYVLRAMGEDAALGTPAKPIPNHVRFQVFQRTAPGSVWEAAIATRAVVGRYGGGLVLCNHVIGAPLDEHGNPPGEDLTDTEQYVTHNEGKTGAAVKPSPISNTSRPDNRGCMSARRADWLARQGYKHAAILRYFYGADLHIGPLDIAPPKPQPQPQPHPPQPPDAPGPAPTIPANVPATPANPPADSSASPLPALALAALAYLAKEGL